MCPIMKHAFSYFSTFNTHPCQILAFFSLKSKAQRCLTYTDCNYLGSKVHSKNVNPLNSLYIFHQNIRGLRNKSDELIHSFEIDSINPQILRLSEHHMVEHAMCQAHN
jgi:hypothetical protein